MNFLMETWISLFCYKEKEFIHMNTWEKFDEKLLPKKGNFDNDLNTDISDIDYRHVKRVFRIFNIKHISGYHDLYVQSDTLSPSDKNVRGKCIEIQYFDSVHFLSALVSAGEAYFKRIKNKIRIVNRY